MTYEKQTWIDGVSPLNAERFNHMEDGIAKNAESKLNKAHGTESAGQLLYIGADGNVTLLKTGEEIALEKTPGKNIAFGDWIPGRYEQGTGSLTYYTDNQYCANMALPDKFAVKPGTNYTVSIAGTTTYNGIAYLFHYNADGVLEKSDNYFWHTKVNAAKTFTTHKNAAYISIYIYLEDRTALGLTWRDCIPENFMIEEGSIATEYEPYTATDTLELDVEKSYDKFAEDGLLRERLVLPAYYHTNDYIGGKCTRIRELINECAGDGDAFMFVTDQHWELSARNSPALMRYIYSKVSVPRVFSGGDTADSLHEDYAMALSAAYDGKIYHATGNHDYFGTQNGSTLAYLFDMGKSEQIGNAKRHYYYVDNPQQKIRYIVLCAFSNETGELITAYDEEQVAWLRDSALNVEDGWTVLVFTHSLYYGFGEEADFVPTPDGASDIITVLDAAECDVACVLNGHAHLDRICHTPGGIPVVVTTSDKCDPWISGGVDMEPWLTESRIRGTITEQAFDVVVLDKANRKLTFVRIGAPADNWTDGTSTGTVEERVITY